jgi:hypothetical protein
MTHPAMGKLARRLAVTALVAGAALLAGAQPAARSGSSVRGSSPLEQDHKTITVEGVPDPHGDPGGCTECHAAGSDGVQAQDIPDTAACTRCHPDTNFHSIGSPPVMVTVPPELLLEEGRLACVTCHDEPACDGSARDARGPDHFRGGPYPSSLDLCFRCHERSGYLRTDPHRDLRSADGLRNDAVCVFCHQGVPESAEDPSVQALRVNPVELCKGCHAQQIHVGIPSHLVIAPPETAALIGAYNESHEYPIPLGPRGEITCTTCHDPHPGMVALSTATSTARMEKLRESNREYRDEYYLPRLRSDLSKIRDRDDRPLDLQDGPSNKGGLLRVPAEDGSLCLVCHDLGGV